MEWSSTGTRVGIGFATVGLGAEIVLVVLSFALNNPSAWVLLLLGLVGVGVILLGLLIAFPWLRRIRFWFYLARSAHAPLPSPSPPALTATTRAKLTWADDQRAADRTRLTDGLRVTFQSVDDTDVKNRGFVKFQFEVWSHSSYTLKMGPGFRGHVLWNNKELKQTPDFFLYNDERFDHFDVERGAPKRFTLKQYLDSDDFTTIRDADVDPHALRFHMLWIEISAVDPWDGDEVPSAELEIQAPGTHSLNPTYWQP